MSQMDMKRGTNRILGTTDAYPRSLQRYARIGGLLILVSFPAALFGEVYVPSLMSAAASAMSVTNGLGSHDALMRIGLASYLVEAVCDVILTLILYVILRPVEKNIALLIALFRVASTATFAASEFFYISAMLYSGEAKYMREFSTAQLDALTRFSFGVYGYGGSAPVFYGMAAVLTGYLIFHSGFLPKFIGALWVLGGLGQIANTFSLILVPQFTFFWEMVPLLLAMLTLALWFLVRGIDLRKWADCDAPLAL
jgi:hypothetical protein